MRLYLKNKHNQDTPQKKYRPIDATKQKKN